MKPTILKGTRDFLPSEVLKRTFIFDTIESVFKKYGYQPIETPAMENLKTLTGKYGDEGDKLLFRILNNGDFIAKVDDDILKSRDSQKIAAQLSKRGLRYDLTVPMARYVVMHQNDLNFPFKRYQIQPVWRADRPQKGRYQEFYQCDVDVVGSDSLMYEAELVRIYDEVFSNLALSVDIRMNNRKLLAAIAAYAGLQEKMAEMTTIIDKLDKIGWEGVENEMIRAGYPSPAIEKVVSVLSEEDEDKVRAILMEYESGKRGFREVDEVLSYLKTTDLTNAFKFDLTLARGLDYYTGCIFEVRSREAQIGSIGGGGRYDDLTSIFGMKNTSGVGVSFGAERIYDIMEELDKFPSSVTQSVKVIVLALDRAQHVEAYKIGMTLRNSGIPSDVYPDPVKLKKQLKYANDRNIPFVIIVGEKELREGTVTVKDMLTGDQEMIKRDKLIDYFGTVLDVLK